MTKRGVTTQVTGSQRVRLFGGLCGVLPGTIFVHNEIAKFVGSTMGHSTRVLCGETMCSFVSFTSFGFLNSYSFYFRGGASTFLRFWLSCRGAWSGWEVFLAGGRFFTRVNARWGAAYLWNCSTLLQTTETFRVFTFFSPAVSCLGVKAVRDGTDVPNGTIWTGGVVSFIPIIGLPILGTSW